MTACEGRHISFPISLLLNIRFLTSVSEFTLWCLSYLHFDKANGNKNEERHMHFCYVSDFLLLNTGLAGAREMLHLKI